MHVTRRHLISTLGASTALVAARPAIAAPLTSTLGRDAAQYGVRAN